MEEIKKSIPTESQIDVVMSDWLGNLRMNEIGNFTHVGKSGIKTKRDTTVRENLAGDVSGLDPLDLIKIGRQASEMLIDVVTNKRVQVQVGKSTSFQLAGEDRDLITLATDYFDDPSLTSEEKIDIMLGLAAHEGSHSAYTENDISEKHLKKENDDQLKSLKHTVWNIIEDERIEYHLGEDRPGFVEVLGAMKEYYFKKLRHSLENQKGQMPHEAIPKLLSTLIQAIRYPSEMTRKDAIENFEDLDAIRKTLTPYPLSPEAAWDAAERVMDIIRKKAEEELKKEQEKQQEEEQRQQQQQQNKKQGNDGSSPSSSGKDKQSKDNGNASGGKEEDKKRQPTKKEIDEAVKKALSTEEGKRVMSALTKDENKAESGNQSAELLNSENAEYVNDDTEERMCSRGGDGRPDTWVKKPRGDVNVYNQSLDQVRSYIPAMSKALRCKTQEKDYVLLGQKSGKLNTNRLVSLKAGNENIFTRSGRVTCSSASVCILIDESGSMGGAKLLSAREAAILVNEAIKRIKNVNFFCYGYTDNLLNVYSEGGKTSPWALSETDNLLGTPTGKAMEMVSVRMRQFTNDPILMLVLTDGAANDNSLVVTKDRELRKKRIFPVGIGVLTNAVANSFKDFVEMRDIAQLPVELGKLMKTKLEKMLVRTDSNS